MQQSVVIVFVGQPAVVYCCFQQVLHASPEQSQPILLHLFSSSRFDLLVIQFNGTRLVAVMLEDKAITHTQFCC